MLYEDNYLQDYEIKVPFFKESNTIINNYDKYIERVINAWNLYNSFMFATKLVLNHPNYSDTNDSLDEVLYDENLKPNSINSFNTIYKSSLFHFIYDNVALKNIKKVIQSSNTSNNIKINNLANIENQENIIIKYLISNNNDTDIFSFTNLDRILIFIRKPLDILYKITDQEKIFIMFIINILNYYFNFFTTQNDDTIVLNNITDMEIEQIQTILNNTYKLNENSIIQQIKIITDNIKEIAYFVIPYIKKLHDTFINLGIPQYFLGISIIQLLLEEKKKNLILIANIQIDTNLFIENNFNTDTISLCDITLPLFNSYYTQ